MPGSDEKGIGLKKRLAKSFSVWFSFRLKPVALLVVVVGFLSGYNPLPAPGSQEAESTTKGPGLALELKVGAKRKARAFCNGMQTIVSMGGFFEFYERTLTQSRKRVAKGPGNTKVVKDADGNHHLAGNDPISGAAFEFLFKQIDLRTIEIAMDFKAPAQASHLDFEILKLNGDVFKGAAIETSPDTIADANHIPVEPLPVNRRMLFRNKKRVYLRGFFCDLEISDLNGSTTMRGADFRNIPWDEKKSILFSGVHNNLLPGQSYSFRYCVRCFPPSLALTVKHVSAKGSPVRGVDEWGFYSVKPKEVHTISGRYQVHAGGVICGSPTGTAERVLSREMEKLTSIKFPIKEPEKIAADKGIYIERGNASDLPPEGFEIAISSKRVHIRGIDDRACLYGVYTLLGRLALGGNRWAIDCGTIRDWPDLAYRGVCIEMLSPAIHDVSLMKRYLDAFSRARSNVVIFLHPPRQVCSWPENGDQGGWTKKQIEEVVRYARSLHLAVWAGMGSKFESSDFPELDIMNGSNFYNPFIEDSYHYLFSLYDEILSIYHPETLLISHDEIKGLSLYATGSGKNPAQILAMDIGRIHQQLAKQGVKTAIWGDMLLEHTRWQATVGAANSDNPALNSGSTHHAMKDLPSDLLILDWHYLKKNNYTSIAHFQRNGYSVIGCSWYDPEAAKSLANSAVMYKADGVISTDWGFLRTLSPAATTLYAPLCGWAEKCAIQPGDVDLKALAATMREAYHDIDFSRQTVAPLSGVANGTTSGLFGVYPLVDLRALSPGRQLFGHVQFDIVPDKMGEVNNCVIVSNADALFGDNREVFKGCQGGKAVAFLHTCMAEEPQYRPRKLGTYIIEYENGRHEELDLLENWNITDIRSREGLRHNDWRFSRCPEVLIGAQPAWRGMSTGGSPLNIQLFIHRNPFPGSKIRSIRLSVSDASDNVHVALLGLTFLN